jgi:integrase
MAYITQRSTTFYVVDYRGRDPITGSERRKWHHCGPDRADAQRLLDELNARPTTQRARGTLEAFMTGPWLATKHTLTAATRTRYRWMIDHNITPRLGHVRLDALRSDDLDTFYADLIATGGRRRHGLAPKTVLEIHRVISNALDLAVDRHLIPTNPARHARPPKPGRRSTTAQVWTAEQLAAFLHAIRRKRLYPALHLAAHTGIRRGELAGLNWGDLDRTHARLSITRSRQAAAGTTVEAAVKTRTSRRSIDLDETTLTIFNNWRRRLTDEGADLTGSTPMFLNTDHRPPAPDSFSQLFTRSVAQTELPHIRFHDLRHTHASLLVAAGVPIKVVSERLGHAHPGFTMHTYQHVLPGMGATAAHLFAQLVEAGGR